MNRYVLVEVHMVHIEDKSPYTITVNNNEWPKFFALDIQSANGFIGTFLNSNDKKNEYGIKILKPYSKDDNICFTCFYDYEFSLYFIFKARIMLEDELKSKDCIYKKVSIDEFMELIV